MEAFYKSANYALIQQTDMSLEMKEEAVDICTQAIEKHSADLEKASQVSPSSSKQVLSSGDVAELPAAHIGTFSSHMSR